MYTTLLAVPTHIRTLIDRLRDREGGVSDRRADRGGFTNYGITLLTLQRWRPGSTREDLLRLTWLEAVLIYSNMFWSSDLQAIYSISAIVAEQVFDWGVNSGPDTAIKQLQKFLGVKADGDVGPVTTGALIRYLDKNGVRNFVHFFADHRLAFFINICQDDPTQLANLEGWFNRVTNLRYQP